MVSDDLLSTSEFVPPNRRLQEISGLVSRMKERREENLLERIGELELENEELRRKYKQALQLLSMYKSKAELVLKSSSLKNHVEQENQEIPIPSKRSLLAKYLEIHNASTRRDDTTPSSASRSGSLSKTKNIWKEKLMELNGLSPREPRLQEENEQDELIFGLAKSLNSGEFLLDRPSGKQADDQIEEISHLLRRRNRY